jgi:hypothetical protein
MQKPSMGTTVVFDSAPNWYRERFAKGELMTGTFLDVDGVDAIIKLKQANGEKNRSVFFLSGEKFDDSGEFHLKEEINF